MQGIFVLIIYVAISLTIQNPPKMVYIIFKNKIESLELPNSSQSHEANYDHVLFHNVITFSSKVIDGQYNEFFILFPDVSFLFKLTLVITHKEDKFKIYKQILGELFATNVKFTKSDLGTYSLVAANLKVNSKIIENDLSNSIPYSYLSQYFKVFQYNLHASFVQEIKSIAMNFPLSNEELNFKTFVYKLKNKRCFLCHFTLDKTRWIINIKFNTITSAFSDSCLNNHCQFHEVAFVVTYSIINNYEDIIEYTEEVIYETIFFGYLSFSMDTPFKGNPSIAQLTRSICEREYKYYIYDR